MKFTVSVPDLQYAMRLIRGVTASSGAIIGSPGVLISTTGGACTFTAFNSELMVKATVKIEPDIDGEALVDAVALYGAISCFQPENDVGVGTSHIKISMSPRAKKLTVFAVTKYATGNVVPHKRAFALIEKEFFPDYFSLNKAEKTFELPAAVIMDGLDGVAYAASSDKSRLLLTGVLLHLENNKLTLFATNGICLAEYVTDVEYSGTELRILLPGNFASKVSKSFFDRDILKIALTKSMIFMSTPNLVIGGNLIGEEYPNYKDVLPSSDKFVYIDKHILLDNLMNLTYEASAAEDARVTMHISGAEASLVCGGSTNVGIPVEFEGEATFHCNLKLFASSIRNIAGDILKIGFIDSARPISFSSKDVCASSALNCFLVPLSER